MENGSAQTKRKHPESTTPSSEINEYSWSIKNFKAFVELSNLKELSYTFEAGHTIQCKTTWRLAFRMTEDINKIGLFLRLLDPPTSQKQAYYARFQVKIENVDETIFPTVIYPLAHGRTFANADGFDGGLEGFIDPEHPLLAEGTLFLGIRFEIIKSKLVPSVLTKEPQVDSKKSRLALAIPSSPSKNYEEWLEQSHNSETYSDFQIITKDETVFQVHRCILSARSPAFQRMLSSRFTETVRGFVQDPDICAQVMWILLTYLYTNSVDTGWKNHVEEVVYAANKYELKGLLAYLDNMLITVVNLGNARKYLEIAMLYNLSTASSRIRTYYINT